MKIAIAGSASFRSPTVGTRIHAPLNLALDLANQLKEFGHDVTFFCSEGTVTNAKLNTLDQKNITTATINKNRSDNFWRDFIIAYEQTFFSKILKMENEFDIFYFFTGLRAFPLGNLIKKPVVVTHHDSTHLNLYNKIYRQYKNSQNLYFISLADYLRKKIDGPQYLTTSHNGIDPNKVIFIEKPKNYFSWSGRVVPAKGLHLALKLAEQLKFNLRISGNIGPFIDFTGNQEYFNQEIKPYLNKKNIHYIGPLNHQKNISFIGNSRALIFPSDGHECSPMVVIEAMMSGTPIIATRKGPLPEMIKEGVNGFTTNSLTKMSEYIQRIDEIDRNQCRKFAEKNFSLKRMAKDYEAAFQKAIKLTLNA